VRARKDTRGTRRNYRPCNPSGHLSQSAESPLPVSLDYIAEPKGHRGAPFSTVYTRSTPNLALTLSRSRQRWPPKERLCPGQFRSPLFPVSELASPLTTWSSSPASSPSPRTKLFACRLGFLRPQWSSSARRCLLVYYPFETTGQHCSHPILRSKVRVHLRPARRGSSSWRQKNDRKPGRQEGYPPCAPN
jgi:hypothetical protein